MKAGFGNKFGNKGDSRTKFLSFKGIDATTIAVASDVLFQPFSGKRFIVTKATTFTRKRSGTISAEPTARLTNGTGDDIVADVALTHVTEGRAKALTVITDKVIDYNHPLTLVKTVAASGGGTLKYDLYIEGYLV